MPSSTPMNRIFTFNRVRGFIFVVFGVLLTGKGIFEQQWTTIIFGAAIIAYGAFAPG
jgi:hypothetical protein